MTAAPLIRWFEDCDASSTREVGGKCAALGELLGLGMAVPGGFAVTTAAHEAFVAAIDLRAHEAEILDGLDYEDIAALGVASEKLRELVEGSELPSAVESTVREAYGKLDVPVAVRSSAVAEDMSTASFAGQLQTYLWIEGEDAVVDHVRRCWSGFFTPEALSYREQQGISPEDALMSVGVQRMVKARSAGVMFTINPLNGDRSKVVIESTWGLGEALVSGEVDPDRFTVDKVTFGILERVVGAKQIEHRVDLERRAVSVDAVDDARRAKPSLSDAEVVELVKLGKAIERHRGTPQDIEFAVDDSGDLLILQARAETVWSRKERAPTVEKRGSALEYVLADLLKR